MVEVGQTIVVIGKQNYGAVTLTDGQTGTVDKVGEGYFYASFDVGAEEPFRIDYEDDEEGVMWRV